MSKSDDPGAPITITPATLLWGVALTLGGSYAVIVAVQRYGRGLATGAAETTTLLLHPAVALVFLLAAGIAAYWPRKRQQELAPEAENHV